MTLRDYLSFLRDSWVWVTVSTLIGISLAMVLVLSITPRYAATAQIFLATPGYSATGSLATSETSPFQADTFTQQRARSYVQLASHPDLAGRVIGKLGLDWRPEDLADAISAVARPDTVLIDITVKSERPDEARVLADAVTAELASDIRRLEMPSSVIIPTVEPVVTQRAATPSAPSEPDVRIFLILGAAAGFLAGVTVAVFLRRRSTVVGAAMVEQATGRPVLGVAGDEYPAAEDSDKRWRSLHRNLALEMEDADDRVIVVTNTTTAESASAVAGSLAAALALGGLRTALIPIETGAADYRHYVADDAHHAGSLAEVVTGERLLEAALRPTIIANLFYLAGPGPRDLTHLLRSDRFRRIVFELRGSFDAVIFDAPDLLRRAEPALLAEVADSVVLVATEKVTEVRDLSAAVDLLRARDTRIMGTILISESRAHLDQDNRLLAVGKGFE
ncbi:Wzz/FepE/Etk N-terminal domain-containing protein [Mycobacterium sp. 852014-52144_SCH5372336]|uniref:Wzz/FepE/Etk N-terminal domain-containing protein n=1 Tax=Mycobacterium sp. 852014-52144_SCH5372336 TaxID=1834115 RepID=UPI0008005414|nr:Wzz/FepE/Etk N-terminal domain-containing protein [Mycobacterium sp. 852014-52144_SCH5372336]OBB73330.1 hypothetical protein A5759_15600 [Mycobacterium sp. 852014-52144_SCH5372336]